ncbi:MAG TPA: LysR substrate-binding domain-containing protein [Gemmataceae bacterium]|nr:LysR substrate-binding domain-containing protein [Gemmataceae bacterium]
MELHQLRYFVAVARTGNFSRAAERCHVSQPSLSQQILKLERHLGQRLLNRLGRRAVLTDAGRLLLDRATAILAAVEDAHRRLVDDAGAGTGRLAIGAIPTIAPYLLPPALKRFARCYPQVEVSVQEDVTRNLIAAVLEGELDLALVALPITEERLEVEPLFSEPLLVAVPHGHPLTRRRKITVQDVSAERFILLNEMHCLGEQVLSLCRAHDCQPQIACRSAQIATVQALIALGQGISLLPEMACRADHSKRLVYRRVAPGPSQRTIAAIWHRHSYHSPAADRFLAGLRHSA